MVIKIYGNSDLENHTAVIPNMFFDFNAQPYNFDTENKDIIYDINSTTGTNPISFNDGVKSKIRMLLHLYHDAENMTYNVMYENNLKEKLNDSFYFLTVQESSLHKEYKNLLYNDFWFNMVKGFYTKYPFKNSTVKWYYHNDESYVLPEIPTAECKSRIFVAPNRVRLTPRTSEFRPKLVLSIKKYSDIGHIGCVFFNKSWILWPHGDYPNLSSVSELKNINRFRKEKWGFAPIHYEYLRDTFISIYGETIEYGDEYFVSEKTYDPLIRGHFILPFSNSGFIKRLKSIGFKFPNFINYDYDNIEDKNKRFVSYTDEMYRLLDIKIDIWRQYWNDNIDILRYNRELMLNRPYDRLDLQKLLTNM